MTETTSTPSAPDPAAPVTHVPAEGPRRPSGLALSSLIVGAFAFFIGWVPVFGLLAGATAVTLGVIALVKQQSKGLGIPGVALGGVAALTSLIITLALFSGGTAATTTSSSVADPEPIAVEEPVVETEEAEPEPEPEPEPESEIGTRENPYPAGSVIRVGEWDLSVGQPVFDATAVVLDENMFNPEPDAGNEYALFPISATYQGEGSETFVWEVDITFVTADGRTYDAPFLLVVPSALDEGQEVYTGGTVAGNLGMEIPVATGPDGLIRFQAGLFGRDEVFVALK